MRYPINIKYSVYACIFVSNAVGIPKLVIGTYIYNPYEACKSKESMMQMLKILSEHTDLVKIIYLSIEWFMPF